MTERQRIQFFGKSADVGCDRKCNKAWGINCRPSKKLSEEEDDYVLLNDDELGEAPEDPGTYEGSEGKPGNNHKGPLNKWCVRECERSAITAPGDPDGELVLPIFDNPKPNIPRKENC